MHRPLMQNLFVIGLEIPNDEDGTEQCRTKHDQRRLPVFFGDSFMIVLHLCSVKEEAEETLCTSSVRSGPQVPARYTVAGSGRRL